MKQSAVKVVPSSLQILWSKAHKQQDISCWVILPSSFFVRFVGALGLDFLTTVVLLLQLVDEVCRRTLTVVFACQSCFCALLPIRGGSGERSPSFDLFL